MKKQTKKLLIGIVTVILMMTVLCFSAGAEENDTTVFTVDEDRGILYITGSGDLSESINTELPSSIDTIVIGEGFLHIGPNFSAGNNYCYKNIKKICIPGSVNVINENAFNLCYSLESLIVHETNETYLDIDGVLFNNDKTKLLKYPQGKTNEYYDIPDTVTEIKFGAFENAKKLRSVKLSDNIVKIDAVAFSGCTLLTDVIFSDSLEIIVDQAFRECTSLVSVTIPKNVSHVSSEVFWNCDSLENIYVDDENTVYMDVDGVLYKKDKSALIIYPTGKEATTYEIPEGVTEIAAGAFYSCNSLESVIIPESVIYVGDDAFDYCTALKSIVLPKYIKNISRFTFGDCYAMSEIVIYDNVESIEQGAFFNCGSLELIHYTGTEDKWNKISVSESNECLSSATIHYVTSNECGLYCTECNENIGKIPTHLIVNHSAKAPTCTEIGWDTYETCSRCNYTTYAEKTALGHDEISHSAKVSTCTDLGWDAYVTCSRCDYTTYTEKSATGHNITTYPAKAPTCTEIGWDACEACSRCNYTTYTEKAALGHDFGEWIVTEESTYIKKGTEISACSRCGEKNERKLPLKVSDNTSLDDSGISVGYSDNAFTEEEVELIVKESFDGTEFITIPLNDFTRVSSWNIEFQINGEKVQPKVPVLVSIPLPEGYNPDAILVFHINSETQEAELITPVSVEDGYIRFMASSFSVYTVVDESSEDKGILGFFDKLIDLIKNFIELLINAFKFAC